MHTCMHTYIHTYSNDFLYLICLSRLNEAGLNVGKVFLAIQKNLSLLAMSLEDLDEIPRADPLKDRFEDALGGSSFVFSILFLSIFG